jgi:hypothetical protein
LESENQLPVKGTATNSRDTKELGEMNDQSITEIGWRSIKFVQARKLSSSAYQRAIFVFRHLDCARNRVCVLSDGLPKIRSNWKEYYCRLEVIPFASRSSTAAESNTNPTILSL